MAERIKITYATLRADNEELHAALRGRPREGAGPPGRVPPQLSSTGTERDGDGTFELRSPIDRDILVGTLRRGAPAQDVQDAIAAARAAQPAWAATPLARAAGHPAARRRAHQRAPDGVRRRSWPSRSARTGSRRSARSRRRPTSSATTRDVCERQRRLRPPDGQPRRRGRPHPLDPPAARRVRGHQPLQLPDGALRRARASAALMAGNTVVFKPASAGAMSGVAADRGLPRRRRPGRRLQPRHGPGRHRRRGAPGEPRHRRHRLHRLVRGRLRPLPDLLDALPAPVHRRDGRQEPGHRDARRPTSRRRPRGSCARPSASAARSARPTAASTSSGRSTTSSCGCSSRRPRRSRSATRSAARTGSARSSTSARSTATSTAVAEARRDGRVFIGGERLTDDGMDRGFYVEPTVVGDLPADHRLFRDELFAPFTAVGAVDSLDEALAPRQRQRLRPDGRRLQRGPGRGRALPRRDRGRRPVRQPPRRRDDRRLAGRPGRSAAGRAPARPARPACRCTTSPSSCASRATPSSTDRQAGPTVAGPCQGACLPGRPEQNATRATPADRAAPECQPR